ncbi:MAG: type IV pilus secretin PilQ [Myxococcota bacterium]
MVRSFATVLLAASLVAGGGLVSASAASAAVQVISRIEVQEQDGLTRIVLHGARDAVYTAFMLSSPPRLLLDLPDVVFKGVQTPIKVQNGLVGEITLGAFGDPGSSPSMARMSIGLQSAAEYEVIPRGDTVIVEIRASGAPRPKAAKVAKADKPKAAQKAKPATPAPAKKAQAPKTTAKTAPKTASKVAKPKARAGSKSTGSATTMITKVVPGRGFVDVHADGPMDNVDSFVLHNPERLVVDLWAARIGQARATIPAYGSVVSKVRVGQHPDKVRIVLDLKGKIDSHRIKSTSRGVRIVLTGKGMTTKKAPTAKKSVPAKAATAKRPKVAVQAAPAKDKKMAAKAAKARSKPANTRGPAIVKSVHFESYSELDRVVVTLNRPVEAIMAQPDAATIVVDLPGTKIDKDAERRVDTREFGGPVEIMSAFKTPDVARDQARIVLKRRGGGTPRMKWEGARLSIEVSRTFGPHRTGSAVGGTRPGAASVGHVYKPGAGPVGPTPVKFNPDDFYAGPRDPASIDLLQEGGFDPEKKYEGRRISLDFKDADIGNILRLIADVSDLNIIAGEDVSGTVTIRLVDVPWDQALDVILMTKGLGFMRIGKVLRIAPLKDLKKEEEDRLQERRAREKLEDLVLKLQPVSYANVKDVASLIKKLLSPRGTVNVDKRTSTLIIKDISSVINEATALVKAIDTQTPQVLIEAKIVEASLTFSRSLGAQFGFGWNHLGDKGGAPDFRLGENPANVFGTGGQETNFIVSNPIAASIGTLTMGLLGLDDHLQLDLQLQAAEANNKGKIISSPRVVTLDNTEANIKQGVAIRFDSSDGDSVNTSFVDAVLELKVTPHITADRSIVMKIKVSRNAPQTSSISGDVVGISKNETTTEALVFDGQTIVLGGIYVVDKANQTSKVPFIADIPLIGAAFRNSVVSDIRNELLIFVTPRIVHDMKPAS